MTQEHFEIKSEVDKGDVEIFGMTAGHDTIDRIEGHREWINYHIQNNPNVKIFIAIPQIDFPQIGNKRQEYGFSSIQELYDYFVNDIVHNEMVDQLRIEFPSTKIFTIPTGWASVNLDQMNIDNELDQISRFGLTQLRCLLMIRGIKVKLSLKQGSLTLVKSIYNVDLSTNTYETGFNTDLHEMFNNIYSNHDTEYNN